MLNHALASRSNHSRLVSRCLSAILLASATSIGTACDDATTRIMAPTRPAFDVSGDGTWLVNSLADPGDGVCANNECTLREAIAAAQIGDVITFKSNLSGTINLSAGQLLIDKSLTIEGPGADELAISAQNASRVFQIGTFADQVIVTISGLTVTGGNALPDIGGGIIVWTSSRLALIASFVTLNTALTGGGIQNSGRLTLVRSTVAANHAALGGGIYSGDALTLNRSTVSGNRADNSGGGIYSMCNNSPTCEALTLRSSTITDNDAPDGGGVRLGYPGTAWNSVIAGNRMGGMTSGVSADCATATLTSLGYNLSTLDTGCDLSEPTDVILATPSLVFTSVLQLLLADNGGSTKTHALIERGYAVDAGYCPGETVDQRAFPRPYDDLRMPNALDGCDIGAFEWQPVDTKIKGPKP